MKSVRYVSAILLLTLYTQLVVAMSPPEKIIIETSETMLSKIHKEGDALRENKQKVYQMIEEVIVPHIDFERMSKWVLGKYWRTATDDQKTRFEKEFRSLLMRTYATAISEYSGEKFEYLPSRYQEGDKDTNVRTELRQPGNPNPIAVNYSLHLINGRWLVYDIVIEGVSLISNYRTSFASQIKRSSLDALIEQLVERNKQRTG